jgi:hypothetical protein
MLLRFCFEKFIFVYYSYVHMAVVVYLICITDDSFDFVF